MDVLEDVRRGSVLSAKESSADNVDDKGKPPNDTGYFVLLTILLLGTTSMLASSFTMTATDYWMYKFRDPSSETYNAANRTSLQANFLPAAGVVMIVPTLLSLVCAVTVFQRIKPRINILIAYTTSSILFAMLTLFANVNTDSWQIGFFGLTLIILGGLTFFFIIINTSLIVSIPKLPQQYLKFFLYGQGTTALLSAILQIISLSVGNSSTQVALIYFGSGTTLYIITLVMYIIIKYLPMYQHYVNESQISTRTSPKFGEMIRVIKRIWAPIITMGTVIISHSMTTPNISSLVVSENYGKGDPWSDRYFVPVITFLLADIVNLIGRVFATNLIKPTNSTWFLLIGLVRAAIYPPLFLYCNVETSDRKLETVFTHDWQYILILITFVSSGGYLSTVCILSLPNFKDKTDTIDFYYLGLQICVTFIGILSAPMAIVVVNSL